MHKIFLKRHLIALLFCYSREKCAKYRKKPVLSGHSKKILMTNGSLMKVENITECSSLQTFDLHLAIIGFENQFSVFFLSGRLRKVLLCDTCA